MIRTGELKGTLVVFAEHLTDKNGNLRGWLIGGPTPGEIVLKRLAGFDITDAAALPDGGIVVLERKFSYSEGIQMRIRRIAASELKRGAPIMGEVLLEAERQFEYRQYGGDRRNPRAVGRDRADADVGRQFQRDPAHADHAVHAA